MSTAPVMVAMRDTVPGPIDGTRITEACARTVARDAAGRAEMKRRGTTQ